MTIAEKIKELHMKHPEKVALKEIKTGKSLTFSQIDRKSDMIRDYLRKKGFSHGSRIVVFVPLSLEFYIILTGIFKAGMQAVFIDPYAGAGHIGRCCRQIKPEGIISSEKMLILGSLFPEIRKIEKKLDYRKILRQIQSTAPPYPEKVGCLGSTKLENDKIDRMTPALVSFTSGSTGFPKAIVRTHGFLIGQHNVLERNLKFKEGTNIYSAFPMFLLSHMASGMTTLIPDMDLRKPSRVKGEDVIMQIIGNNVQNIMLPPVVLENIVDYANRKGIAIESVQKIYTGGAPVFPTLMDKIAKVFVNSRLRVLYGASEAEPIAILKYEEISQEDLSNMKNGTGLLAGKKIDEVDLKIDSLSEEYRRVIKEEEKNISLTADALSYLEPEKSKMGFLQGEGEILVKGENVLKGYIGNPGNNPINMNGIEEKEWHATGDIGYIDVKGRIVLLGRIKGRIEIGDKVYYPFSIETAFSFCKEIKKSVLTKKDGRLYLIIERNRGIKKGIRRKTFKDSEIIILKEKFGIHEIIEKKIPVDKRHNGKVDYKKLEGMLL